MSLGIAESFRNDEVTVDEFLEHLHNVQAVRGSSGKWNADCPFCDKGNKKRHLHIETSNEKGGFTCRCNKDPGHGKWNIINEALGAPIVAINSTTDPPKKPRKITKKTTYEYRDTQGVLQSYKYRTDFEDGGKTFYWHKADGTPGKSPDVNLWRAERLAAAPADERLYIVEGEKCVMALEEQGFLATTAPNGGGNPVILNNAELQVLRKFTDVVLIPDNDSVGMQYVDRWRKTGITFNVLPITTIWPEADEKDDIADYFEKGYSSVPLQEWQPSYGEYPPAWKCAEGFSTDSQGVYFADSNGNVTKISTPVTILKRIYNDGETVLLMAAKKRNDEWQEFYVKPSTLASKNKILELCNYDVVFDDTTAKFLVRYFTMLQSVNDIPSMKVSNVLGWVDDEFVPCSNKILVDPANEGLVKYADDMAPIGKYEEWLNAVKPLYIKVPVVRLAVMCSFSSLMNRSFKVEPSFLHIGGESGAGKTVALEVAASCFGNPNRTTTSLIHSFNDTANAIASMASIQQDVPFFINELQTNATLDASQLVMKLCDSREKARLNREATLKKSGMWRCNFITNGEQRLLDENVNTGAYNRVLEIWIKKPILGTPAEFSAFVDTLEKNYGWALREFLRNIDIQKTCNSRLQHLRDLEKKYPQSSDKQRGIAAAWWAIDDELSRFMFRCEPITVDFWEPLLLDVEELSLPNRAWEYIMDVIQSKKACFDKPADNERLFLHNEAEGYEYWGEIHEGFVLIIPDRLKKALANNNMRFDMVKEAWADSDRLEKSPDGKYTVAVRKQGKTLRYVKLWFDEDPF